MTSSLRVGLTLPSFREEIDPSLDVALAAERAGLDAVFAYDHLFRYGPGGEVRPAIELAPALGALAAATHRIAIGSLVARATLRPPAVLANIFDSAARIAGDRVIAGLGAGDEESRDEMVTFGYEFGTMETRLAALDAAVDAVAARGVPVWVGGNPRYVAEATVRAGAWNRWGATPDRFAEEHRTIAALAARIGAAPVLATWGGLCVMAPTDAAAAEKAERLGASPRTLVGSPATMAERLRSYGEAGAGWVVLGPVDSSDPANAGLLGEVRERLAA